MQNTQEFTFESTSPKANTSLEKGCFLSDTALEQILAALQPKPFRKRHPILFWSCIILIIIAICASIFQSSASSFLGNRIAVVRIDGTILQTKELLKWIETIKQDENVNGVLLRIDSGGGGAAASQELYDALQDLGRKKPIITSIGSVAASGGLMVAMASEHIVANPSSVVGSIGVRMNIPQIQGLLAKIGVAQESLTTGTFKDTGAIDRALTEEERVYLQGLLQDMYNQFVNLVAEGRKIPVEKIETIADGRVFTGREAKDLGLVDELGGQGKALEKLYALTKVSPKTPLYEMPKPDALLQSLAQSLSQISLSFLQSLTQQEQQPGFLYQQ